MFKMQVYTQYNYNNTVIRMFKNPSPKILQKRYTPGLVVLCRIHTYVTAVVGATFLVLCTILI
jgi:hypothetical protein